MASRRLRSRSCVVTGAVEFAFAISGGYLGARLGELLMAALTIVGVRDAQMANVQKNWLATVITTISVAVFALGGVVAWPQTFAVLVGVLIGGYDGARLARRVPAGALRIVVIAVGLGLIGYYVVA